MKNKLLIIVLSLLMTVGCSSRKKFKIPTSDVPQAVMTGFQNKYPNATVKEWEAEKEGGDMVYEVGFNFNSKDMEAAFKPDGSFIKEE